MYLTHISTSIRRTLGVCSNPPLIFATTGPEALKEFVAGTAVAVPLITALSVAGGQ